MLSRTSILSKDKGAPMFCVVFGKTRAIEFYKNNCSENLGKLLGKISVAKLFFIYCNTATLHK